MIHVFKNEVIMIQKGHQRIIIYVIFLNWNTTIFDLKVT